MKYVKMKRKRKKKSRPSSHIRNNILNHSQVPLNNLLANQRPRPKRSSTAVGLLFLAALLESLDGLDFGGYRNVPVRNQSSFHPPSKEFLFIWNSPSLQSNPSSPSAASLQHMGVFASNWSAQTATAFSARACRGMVVGDADERAKRVVVARRVRRWEACILDGVFVLFSWVGEIGWVSSMMMMMEGIVWLYEKSVVEF
jgi:hypothetical protein